jgi:hypothetical protein
MQLFLQLFNVKNSYFYKKNKPAGFFNLTGLEEVSDLSLFKSLTG